MDGADTVIRPTLLSLSLVTFIQDEHTPYSLCSWCCEWVAVSFINSVLFNIHWSGYWQCYMGCNMAGATWNCCYLGPWYTVCLRLPGLHQNSLWGWVISATWNCCYLGPWYTVCLRLPVLHQNSLWGWVISGACLQRSGTICRTLSLHSVKDVLKFIQNRS